MENGRGLFTAGVQGKVRMSTRKIKTALWSLRKMTYFTRQNNLIRDKLKELHIPRQGFKPWLAWRLEKLHSSKESICFLHRGMFIVLLM